MNRLKKLRTGLSLTQARLAELAGTSQPQIRRLENGERRLTIPWAERLAPHLGVTAAQLLFPEERSSNVDPLPEHSANQDSGREAFGRWLKAQLWDTDDFKKNKIIETLKIFEDDLSSIMTGNYDLGIDKAKKILGFFDIYVNAADEDVLNSLISGTPYTPQDATSALRQITGVDRQDWLIPSQLQISGRVAVGLWIEVDVFDFSSLEVSNFYPVAGYPVASQSLLELQDQSLHPLANNGDLLLCVDYLKAGIGFKAGDIAIVERSRDGGFTVERTARRVIKHNKKIELKPISHAPRFQENIVLEDDYEALTQVKIVSKVISVIRMLDSFSRF